ncbi:hypothetical protein FRC11_009753, partial [Ceratobasidium sp. 423]
MFFARFAFIAATSAFAIASPIGGVEGQTVRTTLHTLLPRPHDSLWPVYISKHKHDISYGSPNLVTDQGNRSKLNYGSTEGHPNAGPGHYICYIPRNGPQHDHLSLGNQNCIEGRSL